MVKVKRLRISLRADGEILAVLGAEVAGPKRLGAFVLVRPGMTAETWARGTWLRTGALTGPADGRLDESEADLLAALATK